MPLPDDTIDAAGFSQYNFHKIDSASTGWAELDNENFPCIIGKNILSLGKNRKLSSYE